MRYLLLLCLVGCASRKVDNSVIHAIAKETKSTTTHQTIVESRYELAQLFLREKLK